MVKFRLIFAAVLASLTMPSVATAADAHTQRANYLIKQRKELRDNLNRLRRILASGQSQKSRADLKARIAKVDSRVKELTDRIRELKNASA